ncbi:hypothetical protein Bca4012_014771 [Brassica carinata]
MAVLIYVSLLFSVSYSSTFIVTNNCPFTIWPGTLSGSGTQPLPTTGFRLDVGQSVKIPSVLGWSGRIWARTGCNFDANGAGKCMTGDCGGKLECAGGGLVGACNATGCVTDINISCPKELQVMGEEEQERGGVVACKSACEAFGLDQYCCSGQFANPNTCRPSSYSTIFKRACPRAYSYAFDDGSSTFTCKASEYAIIFCPGRVKRPSSQNSDPPSQPQTPYGQPMAPPTQNPYGQPATPQPPPTQNPYGQPMAPPTQNPYGQPMAPPNQNQHPPGPNQNPMTPPQNQNGNGQFMMPPPSVNQAPNDQFMNPPVEDESQRAETGRVAKSPSSSDILRPYPVLLLLGLGLTALRQSSAT